MCLIIEQEDLKRKANLAKERARVKAQKEEQERNARPQAVSSLNALDIPAELASIFNKIEGKQFSTKTCIFKPDNYLNLSILYCYLPRQFVYLFYNVLFVLLFFCFCDLYII